MLDSGKSRKELFIWDDGVDVVDGQILIVIAPPQKCSQYRNLAVDIPLAYL